MQADASVRPPRIWALLGAHRGDNNQVLALAEALGLPFESKILRYTVLRRLDVRLLGASLVSLTRKSRLMLDGEPPDLVISVGHRSTPVVRALRARSGSHTRAVHLGNPRVSSRHFDLLITTPQYPVPDAPNVVRFPLALGRSSAALTLCEEATSFLAGLPQPRHLLLLGGPTRYWQLEPGDVVQAIETLLDRCRSEGGSLLVLGSPRTPADVLRAAEQTVQGVMTPTALVPSEGPPSYGELLTAADTIHVTADSVSMISEALHTHKPLGLVPVRPTAIGRFYMGLMDRLRPGQRLFPRDLRYFWQELGHQNLAGSVQSPRAGTVPDVVASAAELVRQLLALPLRPARDDRDTGQSAQSNPAAHSQG